jgi:integrase
MAELRDMPGTGARALEFGILCASRSGEIRGATWNEIDLAPGLWTIPGKRMKGGVEHQVPLSSRALEILAEMDLMRCGDHVFPGEGGDTELNDMTLWSVIRRMNEARRRASLPPWVDPKEDNREVVPHGFRSSFKD